jgi:nucleoside-diphosphate-sugar epimerase
MRVLVAGGLGFLGSHFCDYLIQKGHSVICVDNLKTGSINNIQHLIKNPNFKYVHWDVNDIIKVECDAIVHMASPTAPADFRLYPDLTIRSNSVGTLNLLELSRELGISMLFISTIRVKDNEENPYVAGKKAGEILCKDYGAKIARCGNIYGPRMNKYDSRVIPTFVRRAKENLNLTLFGDGSQKDSFLYVDDAMDVFYRFLIAKELGLIEIGGEVVTILELASRVIGKTHSNSELEFRLSDTPYKQRELPNLRNASDLFDWLPSVSVSDGLDKFIQG